MNHRLTHYALLAAVLALVALPRLGSMTLWDMDEGVNAECGREMLETGTWIVPTYNYDLRTAKPVMLYWLQRISYSTFGVNEFAARFPSVLLSFGTLLLVYELGRRMFDASTGVLAGIALASCFEFVKLTRAATPDAAFIFFSTLTLSVFWFIFTPLPSREGPGEGPEAASDCNERETFAAAGPSPNPSLEGRGVKNRWLVPTAFACGLAVLTKGPAGLAIPGTVIFLFLAWNRELKQLVSRKLIWAALAFLLVAGPWYGLVTAETRGAYIKAFIGNENVNRFLAPMENHRGPIFYYLVAILVFFAPWSSVIGPTIWNSIRSARSGEHSHRFLLCWIGTVLFFFSVAATKLPNYIAPLYPALALLTANFLRQWALGTVSLPRWVMLVAAGGVIVTGLVIGGGLVISSGMIDLNLRGLRILPDLAPWAALGLIPILAGIVMIVELRCQHHRRIPQVLAIASVLLVGLLAAFPAMIVDAAKGPKPLVEMSGTKQPDRDIRLASLEYTQESLTFYAERRVERMHSPQQAADFLSLPRPSYLFVPAKTWEKVPAVPHRVAARRYDFTRNAEILVVTNEGVQ